GVFKAGGLYSTTPSDVDAIVREHIPTWLANLPKREPGRIVIWAHGGLVGARLGLQIARKHVDWWKRNGVYPIYFVWETGLFDALRSILEAVGRRIPGLGTRDLFDYTTDPLVQEGARTLGGVHVWGAMKKNAELASTGDGGATYVAQRLRELADNGSARGSKRPLEFHAVGHSAGSIFHSWFVPMAVDAGVPAFKSLQLLAPAITIPDFAARLAPRVGSGKAATQAIVYTMKRSYEEDDSCIRIYRKSLLYLVHHALEPERRTPILGLDLSMRADAATAALFGLNGATGAPGRVVWSVTEAGDGQSSSQATTHGGFDDDAATMNSVAANVLGQPEVRERYPASATRSFDDWPIADDWLEGVDLSALGASLELGGNLGPSAAAGGAGAASTMVDRPAPAVTAPSAKAVRPGVSGGARRALCVGIDAYPGRNRLECCVRDTETWGKALAASGFELLPMLTDKTATHAEILRRLRELVGGSKRGDVLVFHYSGHGVQVPDTDGDEEDFTEEALVPIDFEDGAFLLDDDLRAVFDQLPDGVNLTAFIDCCHSGTITRMLGRNADDEEEEGTRSRFLKPTEDWETWMRAYERFRGSMSSTRALVGSDKLRWVTFSACLPTEKALESGSNGHFTRNATRLLSAAAVGFTHRAFQDALLKEFGENRRQTPQLDCADTWRDLQLLQPLV
ncbi:MAG TPA: caspase family protein, partial [Steroidobacteraceae bacterium]